MPNPKQLELREPGCKWQRIQTLWKESGGKIQLAHIYLFLVNVTGCHEQNTLQRNKWGQRETNWEDIDGVQQKHDGGLGRPAYRDGGGERDSVKSTSEGKLTGLCAELRETGSSWIKHGTGFPVWGVGWTDGATPDWNEEVHRQSRFGWEDDCLLFASRFI